MISALIGSICAAVPGAPAAAWEVWEGGGEQRGSVLAAPRAGLSCPACGHLSQAAESLFHAAPLSDTERHGSCSPLQTAGKHGWGRQWGKGSGSGSGAGVGGDLPCSCLASIAHGMPRWVAWRDL